MKMKICIKLIFIVQLIWIAIFIWQNITYGKCVNCLEENPLQEEQEETTGSFVHSILLYNVRQITYTMWSKQAFHLCDYQNCRLTNRTSDFHSHSAVVFFLSSDPRLPEKPPTRRRADQAWVGSWHEPPVNHPHWGLVYTNELWSGTLNWTMSYRIDSDILYEYGLLVKRTPPMRNYSDLFHRKTRLVAWAVGNCITQSERETYVKLLQEHGLEVDTFGTCVNDYVERNTFVKLLNREYKFFLGFESSLCTDYITEKFFRFFPYDVVVVVRGVGNYSRLVPGDTYINTADFPSVKDLVAYLKDVGSSESKYTAYLRNKDRYTELKYYPALCQLCKMVNHLESYRRTENNIARLMENFTCRRSTDLH